MVVEEDAAGAARLVAMRQEEVAVAPGLERGIVTRVVPVAGGLERGVEVGRVLRRLRRFGPHRRQVAAAAEPAFGGDQHPRVEMRRRHARAAHMRDQADAAGPEPRVLLGARGSARGTPGLNSPQTVETFTPTFSNTRPRITLMTPPPPSDPPAIRGRPLPCCAAEPAGRTLRRRTIGRGILDRLERRAEPVAQRLEPGPRRLFQRQVWRRCNGFQVDCGMGACSMTQWVG